MLTDRKSVSNKITLSLTSQIAGALLAALVWQGEFNMALFFKIVFWIFVVAYVAALAIWIIGNYGLFGQERDPLSAVFLVILGQPWIRLTAVLPENLRSLAGALSPMPTLVILYILQRVMK
jgi:hypothetical protein